MEIVVQGPFLEQALICEPILRSLPEWFGIEEATVQYAKDVDAFPTLIALVYNKAVGFLTLKEHNAYAAEIHVMGVRPQFHRQGVGRALMVAAERALCERGIAYLQVKTLSPEYPDENYGRTRQFYFAMGFRPLEKFKELWGKENPCLQMVKGLNGHTAITTVYSGDRVSSL